MLKKWVEVATFSHTLTGFSPAVLSLFSAGEAVAGIYFIYLLGKGYKMNIKYVTE